MDSTPRRRDRYPDFARPLRPTLAAVELAGERHARQRREADDAPFVMHPIEVAALLYENGYPDDAIAAGALRDGLEHTDTTPGHISVRFGSTDAEREAALRRQVPRSVTMPPRCSPPTRSRRFGSFGCERAEVRSTAAAARSSITNEASLEMLAEEIPVTSSSDDCAGSSRRCGRSRRGCVSEPGSPQPAASSRTPSRRASPSPPQRITTSWLYSNTGRATGPTRFIQRFVVSTSHS